jgi:hypothetical protein
MSPDTGGGQAMAKFLKMKKANSRKSERQEA